MPDNQMENISITQSRIRKFIDIKGIKVKDFEKRSNLSNGFVSKIGSGMHATSRGKIQEAFPDLNWNWVLTGDGSPLKSDYGKSGATENITIKPQDPSAKYDTKQINYNNVIPIYEIEIDAGNVSRLIDDNKNVPIAGHIYLKDSENASGLIGVRAKGDSMATFINGGDTMLIRRLESRTFVPPGNAYVIIGKELSVVKYIRNSPDKSKWVLRSHNEFYEDFEINKEDVVHLFIVVKVLKELTY